MSAERLFIKKIEDLEKFMKMVVSHQEFWTEYLFEYLNMPAEYLIPLLDEKDRYFNMPKSMIYLGIKKR